MVDGNHKSSSRKAIRLCDVVDTGDLVVAGPRIEAMKRPAGNSDGSSS